MYSRAFPHTRVTRYTARSFADQNTIKALANFCSVHYFYGLKSGLSDTLKTACKLGRVSRHGLEPKSRKYMRWLLDACTSDFFLLLYFFRFFIFSQVTRTRRGLIVKGTRGGDRDPIHTLATFATPALPWPPFIRTPIYASPEPVGWSHHYNVTILAKYVLMDQKLVIHT